MNYRIPEQIETERLILRTFLESDWKDLYEYYSDEICMKYTSGRRLTDWETWRTMATMIGHWQIRGYGPYALIERTSKKVLGCVGLWYPLEWPEPEIKWGLAKNAWGRGYAREAAETVRQMATKFLPEYHLISLIDPLNVSSIKVATSIGAKYEKTIPFRDGRDVDLYRHKQGM
jgi:RimJ/RimL family protein N-acetyltransferase